MIVEWDAENLPIKNIFGVKIGYVDNAIKTEFDSGRVVTYQKNSKNKRRYQLSYAATQAQETFFYNWYENTLGGNAGVFSAPNLRNDGTTQTYRLNGTPTSSGLGIKEINMEWEEV